MPTGHYTRCIKTNGIFQSNDRAHGFRALALGILKEKQEYSHEITDRLLAHVPKSSTDHACDRAKFLPQRIIMMQKYADYLDKVYLETVKKGIVTNNLFFQDLSRL